MCPRHCCRWQHHCSAQMFVRGPCYTQASNPKTFPGATGPGSTSLTDVHRADSLHKHQLAAAFPHKSGMTHFKPLNKPRHLPTAHSCKRNAIKLHCSAYVEPCTRTHHLLSYYTESGDMAASLLLAALRHVISPHEEVTCAGLLGSDGPVATRPELPHVIGARALGHSALGFSTAEAAS